MRNPAAILLCTVIAVGTAMWSTVCAANPPPGATAGKAANCPAPAPVVAAPSSAPYLLSSQADFVNLLPPPPASDSEAQRQDLLAVLAAQRAARANGATESAIADTEANCNRFENVLGRALKAESAAQALAFLNKAAGEIAGAAAGQVKRYWRRPRPYAVSNEVQRLGDVAPYAERLKSSAQPGCGVAAQPPSTQQVSAREKAARDRAEIENAYFSYPSGHSTYFTACAILLAEMVPEKRAELFARGRELGLQRLVVGAHYPTDVEGGRFAGTIGVALMSTNPTFQRDFYDMRTPLRAALGLPAELPDLKAAKPKALEDAEKALSDQ